MADTEKMSYAKHMKAAADLLAEEAAKAERADSVQSPLQAKLMSIAKRLAGNLSLEELQMLQVETNVLETVLTAATNYHHHDTNQHHDHVTMVMDPGMFAIDVQQLGAKHLG